MAFQKNKNVGQGVSNILEVVCSIILCMNVDYGKADAQMLEAFKLWCYRKMFGIKWVDELSSEQAGK